MRPVTEVASRIGGFVAAEATFTASAGSGPPTFTFAVALGNADAGACTSLAAFFGCGTLLGYERRRPHYDDEVRFQVRKLRDLVDVVVPFMDEHLPPSYKREQYLRWRAALLDHWEHDARRRRPCRLDGCDEPAVAHERCHRHDMRWRRDEQRRRRSDGS